MLPIFSAVIAMVGAFFADDTTKIRAVGTGGSRGPSRSRYLPESLAPDPEGPLVEICLDLKDVLARVHGRMKGAKEITWPSTITRDFDLPLEEVWQALDELHRMIEAEGIMAPTAMRRLLAEAKQLVLQARVDLDSGAVSEPGKARTLFFDTIACACDRLTDTATYLDDGTWRLRLATAPSVEPSPIVSAIPEMLERDGVKMSQDEAEAGLQRHRERYVPLEPDYHEPQWRLLDEWRDEVDPDHEYPSQVEAEQGADALGTQSWASLDPRVHLVERAKDAEGRAPKSYCDIDVAGLPYLVTTNPRSTTCRACAMAYEREHDEPPHTVTEAIVGEVVVDENSDDGASPVYDELVLMAEPDFVVEGRPDERRWTLRAKDETITPQEVEDFQRRCDEFFRAEVGGATFHPTPKFVQAVLVVPSPESEGLRDGEALYEACREICAEHHAVLSGSLHDVEWTVLSEDEEYDSTDVIGDIKHLLASPRFASDDVRFFETKGRLLHDIREIAEYVGARFSEADSDTVVAERVKSRFHSGPGVIFEYTAPNGEHAGEVAIVHEGPPWSTSGELRFPFSRENLEDAITVAQRGDDEEDEESAPPEDDE